MPDAPSLTFISDLTATGRDLLKNEASGIQSTTLDTSDGWTARLFAFPAGTGLPEHAVDRHAVLHFLDGHATVELGDRDEPARAHTWISIPPNAPHAVAAHTDTLMLLHVRDSSER